MKVYELIRPSINGKTYTGLASIYWLKYYKEYLQIHMTHECWGCVLDYFSKWTPEKILEYFGDTFIVPTIDKETCGFNGCVRVEKGENVTIFFPITQNTIAPDTKEVPHGGYRKHGFMLSVMLDHINYLLNSHLQKNHLVKECLSNEIPQLFGVNTIANPKEQGYHSASLFLSVSVPATQFLLKQSKFIGVPHGGKNMLEHYLAMYPEEKKSDNHWYLSTTLVAGIREHATLHFKTSGNCACMGDMPKERRADRGMEISSHNVDTIQQQFNLLVGIATLWDWVREEIKKEKGL